MLTTIAIADHPAPAIDVPITEDLYPIHTYLTDELTRITRQADAYRIAARHATDKREQRRLTRRYLGAYRHATIIANELQEEN